MFGNNLYHTSKLISEEAGIWKMANFLFSIFLSLINSFFAQLIDNVLQTQIPQQHNFFFSISGQNSFIILK